LQSNSKKEKKVTPPWYVNVGGHLMESVSHGLRKEKRWGGVPKLYKRAPMCQIFIMEDSKTPLLVVDMKQPPLKTQFLSMFYK
jgi:hypothetical protein